jgi:hypothetical protein
MYCRCMQGSARGWSNHAHRSASGVASKKADHYAWTLAPTTVYTHAALSSCMYPNSQSSFQPSSQCQDHSLAVRYLGSRRLKIGAAAGTEHQAEKVCFLVLWLTPAAHVLLILRVFQSSCHIGKPDDRVASTANSSRLFRDDVDRRMAARLHRRHRFRHDLYR